MGYLRQFKEKQIFKRLLAHQYFTTHTYNIRLFKRRIHSFLLRDFPFLPRETLNMTNKAKAVFAKHFLKPLSNFITAV